MMSCAHAFASKRALSSPSVTQRSQPLDLVLAARVFELAVRGEAREKPPELGFGVVVATLAAPRARPLCRPS